MRNKLTACAVCGLWLAALGADAGPPDHTNTPLKDLGLDIVKPRKDPQTGFVIGGKNATALIGRLTHINGRTIADLESDMRPGEIVGPLGKDEFERSRKGFLGKDEKLLEVLAGDNHFVLAERGLTHQELARHLRLAGALARRAHDEAFKGKGKHEKLGSKGRSYATTEFRYHGRKYKAGMICFKGFQESPFRDNTRAACDVVIVNQDSGKHIEFSELVPAMIERYGFYEGKGTPYRLEPAAILEVFDFIKKKS